MRKDILVAELQVRYTDMIMSSICETLMENQPYLFKKLCNGVGSTQGLLNKAFYYIVPPFVRNRIWGLNITQASDIHDVEYTYPRKFRDKQQALEWKEDTDTRFHINLVKLIKNQNSFRWLENARFARADKYLALLEKVGDEAFLANKIILEK